MHKRLLIVNLVLWYHMHAVVQYWFFHTKLAYYFMFLVCLFVFTCRNEIMYSHCNYTCLILSHWKLIYHTCFSYVFLPPIISSWYHHNYKTIPENTTTLLSSVLLLVHSANYNANSNKRLIHFFSIVWYYGDNNFLIQTFNFIAHLDATCMST